MELTTNRIGVGSQITLERANVTPIPFSLAGDQSVADQQRKDLTLDRHHAVCRHQIEHRRIEYIGSSIDPPRCGAKPICVRGLLNEALNVAILIADDDTETRRVVNRCQAN